MMDKTQYLTFGAFHFDVTTEQLWHGQEQRKLTPKAATVLHYLLARPNYLVEKEELLRELWPGTVVSEAALTVCIRELRRTLGDDAKDPRYIETVHRRGYRFIAPLSTNSHPGPASNGRRPEVEKPGGVPHALKPDPRRQTQDSPSVGRERELSHLHHLLAKALTGDRQLVFVTGEPGIGKTTLVEVFLQSLASRVQSPESQEERQKTKGKEQKSKMIEPQPLTPAPWIARGQCIEHYGAGEGYLPILTALEHLCREPGHERLLALLRQYAPLWLVQLPSILSPEERERLSRELQGAARERMLREMVTLLEVLTAETPLILVLEDLHWSDPSTLDLLAMIARRGEPGRLLVLGTYRPSEIFASTHPLRAIIQELLGHRQCQELKLEGLSTAAIEQYLAYRFPVHVFPTRLAQVLHQRTEGNPLFLVNLIEDLITQHLLTDEEGGWMVHGELDRLVQHVPESSRQLITMQMARVSPAIQQMLAASSVTGAMFSAAAVAAALETSVTMVETQCEEVVQRHLFIQRAGIETWPDGTTAARYRFRHALYQQLWYEQGTVTQRQEWHLRIGLRKELAYDGRAVEIATELALHFEQGQDRQRAIEYYQHAASTATQRLAYQEAIAHFTAALSVLKTLPETVARHQQELHLQISLHWRIGRSKGEAAPEREGVAARMRELLQWGEEPLQLFGAVFSLWNFYLVRVELASLRYFGDYGLRLARRFPDQPFLGLAYFMLGCPDVLAGDFLSARTALEQAMAAYAQPPPEAATLWETGLCCFPFAAWTLWQLGFPTQALHRASETITKARACGARFIEAYGLNTLASVQILRGDVAAVRTHTAAALQLAKAHEFAPMQAMGRLYLGWALSRQEDAHAGIVQLRQGIADLRSTSGIPFRTYYLGLLAEAYGRVGQRDEGLSVLAEALALVGEKGERFYEAELYRLKGELTLQKSKTSLNPVSDKSQAGQEKPENPSPQAEVAQEAGEYFLKAVAVARKQQAKSLELRAVMSLSRLWQSRGKKKEAHQVLSEVYNWFTEGFDTKDLQEAKALLEELSH